MLRYAAPRIAAAALALGGLGFATLIAGADGPQVASAAASTIFCNEFVPEIEAGSYHNKWTAQNPGERVRWEEFRTAICSGSTPSPPAMLTHYGAALVAAGKLALEEPPPPPPTTTTTTTEPPPTTTTEPPPPPPPPSGALLRDKPPGYPDYVGYVRITHDCRGYYNLDDTKDYLFVGGLGNCSYPEGIYIEGGRNVVIIGGHITATGSSRALGVGLSLRGRVASAHHYVEGVYVKPAKVNGVWQRTMLDGIATRGGVGKITLQNVRVGPVAIKSGYNETQGHADILQVQAGPWEGELRVHRMTGFTDYTAIMESEILVRKQNWHQIDLHGIDLDPAEIAWTTFYANNSVTMAGLTISEFYVDKFGAGAVPSSLNNILIRGLPPGGDFVTEAMVALPYQSPGYS